MHNPGFVLENKTHKLFWNFQKQTDHLISARRPDLVIVNNNNKKKKKRESAELWILQFQLTREWNWKKAKRTISTWTVAKELKKLWNMKVTVIPIVIGALITITKGLIKGLEDLEIRRRVETIQTLRSARILKIQETFCHPDAVVKNSNA